MAILIVEDNPVNAQLLRLMLEQHGYRTVSVLNGKEAMAKLAEQESIELIITDFMMPEMDGLELIEKVKGSQALKHIPMIMASAHSEIEIVRRAKDLGCESFIVKPIDKKQLIKRVEQQLQSSPVVLRDKNYMMNKLNMEPAEYDSLARIFAAQLNAIMPIMVLEKGESEENVSENLGQLLRELVESAGILGAERFARLHASCIGSGRLTRVHCGIFIQGLQELERALGAYAQVQPNVPRRTDAA